MESLLAASSVATASLPRTVVTPPSVLRATAVAVSGNAASRGVRCTAAKVFLLDHSTFGSRVSH
jgi:hypothetical protein